MKKYKITFTNSYQSKFYDKKVRDYWQPIVKELAGKEITLDEIPALVDKFGEIILDDDEIEIYNDYRE